MEAAAQFGAAVAEAPASPPATRPAERPIAMATVAFLVHPDRPDARRWPPTRPTWLDRARGHGAGSCIQRSRPGARGRERERAGRRRPGRRDGGREPGRRRDLPAPGAPGLRGRRPVLGVNFGRLGYLLELVPDQVREALDQVFEGRAVDRGALRARGGRSPTVPRRCRRGATVGDVTTLLALNEVVIEKTDFGHTVRLATADRRRAGPDLLGRRAHHRHADRLDRLQPLGRRARSSRPRCAPWS